eukprot:1034100-Rhodomonas_salina.2
MVAGSASDGTRTRRTLMASTWYGRKKGAAKPAEVTILIAGCGQQGGNSHDLLGNYCRNPDGEPTPW